ncbi:50S ribosomal protein L4 [Nanoarchaeota archaeon]|nr:MAG: 50S ribosomal protein L4 [Nanoarchaeota archaeon]
MKVNVYSINCEKVGSIELPPQFKEEYRPDLIQRAIIALFTHQLQPKGTDVLAGKRKVVWLSKRRRAYKGIYGYGISRTPRKTLWRRGERFYWVGAFAPQTVGGREAHPPKVEKVIYEKINKKERRKAIRSALAATLNKELLSRRHKYLDKVKEVPLVINGKIEEVKKAKEFMEIMKKFGVDKEIERAKEKKVRSGKGKMRGRRYKKKVPPLVVVSKKCDLMKAARNLVDVVQVKDLNPLILCPGGIPRLVIWSKDALEKLAKEKLFM